MRGGVPEEITDDVIVGGIRERRVGGAYGGVKVTVFIVRLSENGRAGVAFVWVCESNNRKLVTCYETRHIYTKYIVQCTDTQSCKCLSFKLTNEKQEQLHVHHVLLSLCSHWSILFR